MRWQVSLQYRLIPQNISSLYSEFNQNYEQVPSGPWDPGRTPGRTGRLEQNVQATLRRMMLMMNSLELLWNSRSLRSSMIGVPFDMLPLEKVETILHQSHGNQAKPAHSACKMCPPQVLASIVHETSTSALLK